MFKKGRENILEDCKKIFIVAKAVRHIVEEYCETGDQYLGEMIKFIKENRKVEIYSPDLKDLIQESLTSEDDMIMLMTKVLALEINETIKQRM